MSPIRLSHQLNKPSNVSVSLLSLSLTCRPMPRQRFAPLVFFQTSRIPDGASDAALR
jgi:hypothetical protein